MDEGGGTGDYLDTLINMIIFSSPLPHVDFVNLKIVGALARPCLKS